FNILKCDTKELYLIENTDTSINKCETVKPKVFRVFDRHTGQVMDCQQKVHSDQYGHEGSERSKAETNSELIYQTAYKDISVKERELLENAVKQAAAKARHNKYLSPVFLVIFFILAGIIAMK
ncbi:MAG: hypothetical protein JKX98_02525, partial [Alcanivoracaceae bacterium]|nr:hypothetical protein [Alcanivoracaceae bacterium]